MAEQVGGWRVESVIPGSPAAMAGIQPDDIIVEMRTENETITCVRRKLTLRMKKSRLWIPFSEICPDAHSRSESGTNELEPLQVPI